VLTPTFFHSATTSTPRCRGFLYTYMKNILLFLLLLLSLSLNAQWNDNIWILKGLDKNSWPLNNQNYLMATLDFKKNNLLEIDTAENLFGTSLATIIYSGSDGKLKYFSSGCEISDKDNTKVIGSDSLWFPFFEWARCNQFGGSVDFPNPLGFFMPVPEHSNETLLFTRYAHTVILPDTNYVENSPFLINISVDSQNGQEKAFPKIPLLPNNATTITANKHANGRDWWILMSSSDYSQFYRYLLTPNGLQGPLIQDLSNPFPIEMPLLSDYSIFSPNGSLFIQFHYGRGMSLFDFDRCSGLLTNERQIIFTFCGENNIPNYSPGGVAFSPNSRFLYFPYVTYSCVNGLPLSNSIKCQLIQYDLEEDGFPNHGDTVGVYENIIYHGQQYYLFYPQLAPNGKIYYTTGTQYISAIRNPNEKGLASNYVNREIDLPFVLEQYQIPYFPNYRLGPIDGSPCDSLGLDNHPLAQWRWEQEDSSQLSVTFTDNSFYEPATWHWDFAGLGVSQDTSPVFTFPQAGVYEVCMTVCNAYSCDTLCRQVNVVSASGTKSADNQGIERVEAYPNPTNDWLHIKFKTSLVGSTKSLQIIDLTGKIIKTGALNKLNNAIDVHDLQDGMYFVKINQKDIRYPVIKFIKI
jgi:hypothetical protein